VDETASIDRRALLGSGAATFAVLMFAGGASAAQQRTKDRHMDPRYAFADRVADIVIPRTDTPGASDVSVANFLLMALDERMGSLDPAQLARIRVALDTAAGGAFLTLPRPRQESLVGELDARAFAGQAVPGTAEVDWQHLKAAILAGYYTSEVGAGRELVYDPVPGTRENITLTSEFRATSNPGFGGSL
jgi:Gluconate 2-dehydrogenase subunit 3